MTTNTTYIDLLSGEELDSDDIVEIRSMPIPSDNWYEYGLPNSRRYWGTAPLSEFALVDDGGDSPRWLPVEEASDAYLMAEDAVETVNGWGVY